MRDGVWLITDTDQLGRTLRGLAELLRDEPADLFVGVRVLPFFIPISGSGSPTAARPVVVTSFAEL